MERPVRVLYFTADLGPGGSEAHLTRLLTSLDRRRVDPQLMLMRPAAGHHQLDSVRRAGVPIHDLQIRLGRRGIVPGLARTVSAVGRIRPDVVHSYGYPCDIYAPLAAAWRRGMRVVTSRRGNQQRARRRLLYRLTNPLVDRVVCVSTSALRFAARTEKLTAEHAEVIPNGIDVTGFPAIGTLPKPLTIIGTHGRIRPIKGIDLLLAAFERLERPELRLRIAGAVDDAWGRELRRRHDGKRGVEFVGEVADVSAFLRSLHVYVLPSRSEGMSMSLLESMASSLPIVATDVGSNAELLHGGQAGLLVEPESASIAGGLTRILGDAEAAEDLRRAARQRVEGHYTHRTMVENIQRLYETIRGDAGTVSEGPR